MKVWKGLTSDEKDMDDILIYGLGQPRSQELIFEAKLGKRFISYIVSE